MDFHSWIFLDARNRVCRHCNQHERVHHSDMQHRNFEVVRQGTRGTCSIGGHLVRAWTKFWMGKK